MAAAKSRSRRSARDVMRRFDIPCEIADEGIRDAIAVVLHEVQKFPHDWARIRRRVLSFAWLPEVRQKRRFLGMWKADADAARRFSARFPERAPILHVPGRVLIAPRLARWCAVDRIAVVAHELGHVATRESDFMKREAPFGATAWAAEACADMYAFRWGFERHIRAFDPRRTPFLQAPLPGDGFMVVDGIGAFYLDKHFMFRRVKGDLHRFISSRNARARRAMYAARR